MTALYNMQLFNRWSTIKGNIQSMVHFESYVEKTDGLAPVSFKYLMVEKGSQSFRIKIMWALIKLTE